MAASIKQLSRFGFLILLGSVFDGCSGGEPEQLVRLVPSDMNLYVTDKGGQQKDVSFQLVNGSEGQVVVESVRTSCGCTTPRIDQDGEILDPGESLLLPLRVSLPEYGTETVWLTVQASMDSEPLRAPITLVGNERALPYVLSMPSEVIVNGEYDSRFQIMTLERSGEVPWINGLQCAAPGFRFEIESIDSSKGRDGAVERTYRCSAISDAKNDDVGAYVVLKTNGDEAAERFVVAFKPPRHLRSVPASLLLIVDKQKADKPIQRQLRIVSEKVQGFSVVEVEADIPDSEIEWTSHREGFDAIIEMSFSVDCSEFNGADASGHVVVTTDHPVIQTVVVPVVLTTGE